MSRELIDIIDQGDMWEEVYLEDDGTYYHDVYEKEDDYDPDDTGEYYHE